MKTAHLKEASIPLPTIFPAPTLALRCSSWEVMSVKLPSREQNVL